MLAMSRLQLLGVTVIVSALAALLALVAFSPRRRRTTRGMVFIGRARAIRSR
jgi:hypothetical protein